MDDQRKDLTDTKRPLSKKHPKQLQTHNVTTYNVENAKCTNKGRDLRLANKLRIVPRGIERMPQMIQRYRIATLH